MLILSAALTLADPAALRWPDTPAARTAARAALERLQLQLSMRSSATLVLDDWCREHGLAPAGSKTVAERDHGVEKPATPDIRALLSIGPDEPVRYRRVQLICGGRTLSIADNWYVPSRLTAAMNATLDTTDTSFGRVVGPLDFSRRTLSSALLWPPQTPGWADRPAGKWLKIPAALIENRAVLSLPDGRPISLVDEVYSNQVLAFAPAG